MGLTSTDLNRENNRIQELDIVKGISIIGVMYVHFDKSYILNVPGIAFHVVSFFAVAGVLINNQENINLTDQVMKRVKSILVPYWLLSVIYSFVHLLLSLLKNDDGAYINFTSDLYHTISGLGIGTLWFLPTLFGAEIIYIFLKKYIKYYRRILALCFLPVVFICELIYNHYLGGYIDANKATIIQHIICIVLQIIIAVCVMAIGTYIWKFVNMIQKSNHNSIYLIVCTIMSIVIDVSLWEMYRGNDLHLAKITDSISYVVCAITSMLAVFCISKLLANTKWVNKALSYLGRNSLIVMTTHLEYKMVALSQFVAYSLFGSSLICKALSLPILCVIEVIICIIVNKTFLKKIYRIK